MLSRLLVGAFVLFATFQFCQSMHVVRFEGASQRLRRVLGIFTSLTTIFQFGFLAAVGVRLGWPSALKLFGLELLSFVPISFLLAWSAKNISRDTLPILSIVGLAVMPILAIMMVRALILV